MKEEINKEIITLEQIVHAVRKRWKLILIIMLSFTIISAILSFFVIKPKYECKTKVFIGKEEKSHNNEYSNNDVQMYQRLIKTYAEVIKTSDLISKALKSEGLDLDTKNVTEKLMVEPSADTQILEIKYKDTNKEQCLNIIQAITKEFIKESKILIPNGNIQIIGAAVLPKESISPNKAMNIIIAFILGIIISIGVVFLLEYLDNSFKTKDDLEKYLDLPVLGIIPDYENE